MFELWEDTGALESRCFARRTLDEVNERYHDMNVGEIRTISPNTWIIRTEVLRNAIARNGGDA